MGDRLWATPLYYKANYLFYNFNRTIMKKRMDLKTGIGIGLGIIIAAVLLQIVAPKLFVPSIDSQLMSIANEMNKNCPFMVDAETRLDNTMAGEGETFYYNFTLVNLKKSDINTDRFESIMKPQILNVIKTNPDMKYLRDNDVTFIYNYKDESSVHVTSIKYTPEDYRQ